MYHPTGNIPWSFLTTPTFCFVLQCGMTHLEFATLFLCIKPYLLTKVHIKEISEAHNFGNNSGNIGQNGKQ